MSGTDVEVMDALQAPRVMVPSMNGASLLLSDSAVLAPLRLTRDEYHRIAHASGGWSAAATAMILVALVESPWGRASTGVVPWWIAAISTAWVIASPLGTHRLSSYEAFSAADSNQRDREIYATVIYTSAFGAVSRFDAAPTYAFLFAAVINLGWMFVHRRPVTLVVVALCPLALRWVAVADASTTSLLVALGCGVGTVLGTIAWGRRCERDHPLRVAAELERARVADERDATQHLRAAMALHDGISGAVLVLENKLASVTDYAEAQGAVRTILGRVRAVTEGHSAHRLDALATELPLVASWVGARCHVMLGPEESALSDGERRDLSSLAWEASMNALRAGVEQVDVTIDVSRDRVGLTCTGLGGGQHSGRAGTGRGLRYAASRALARGGDARLEAKGMFVATWPRRRAPTDDRWVLPVTVVGIAAGAIALAAFGGHLSSLWLAALGAAAAAAAFHGQILASAATRSELDALEVEALALGEQRTLGAALGHLAPGATALAHADESASLSDARAGARRLAEGVGHALRAIEAAG
jgi:hypothetical protein